MTPLLIIHVLITVGLVAAILMQRSSADSITGIGGMGGEGLFSRRGSSNLLTKATSILATLFIINSLVLAYMASHTERAPSITKAVIEQQAVPSASEEKPAAPAGEEGAPETAPETTPAAVPVAE